MKIAAVGTYLSHFLQMAAAYKAKLLCSGIFVSGRDKAALLKEDLAVGSLAPLRLLASKVDFENKTVTVSCLGGFRRVALYRPGLGSTLVLGSTVEALQQQAADFEIWRSQQPRHEYGLPMAISTSPGSASPDVDSDRLAQVVAGAFDSRFSPGGGSRFSKKDASRTRAIAILHKGEIIAERYAPGFSARTPLLGWSMAKSVVNALIGILVKAGKLSLDAQGLLPEWRGADDPRREITLAQLLSMSSGLRFSEEYADPLSDVITMLFHRGDGAAYAAQRPLQQAPGSAFCYAGGATVLLCRIIREAVGGSLADYFAFPRRALFDRVGMGSAVMEPDAAGTFTGSSFMYATARDWAKFGLLYLQDGCWEVKGEWQRILPEGWVRYSAAPSERADFYGAHFWRGVPNSFTDGARSGDGGWPQDAYLAAGYQGQFVTVVPSCELVVVRLGLSQARNSWDQVRFIEAVVKAVKG